MGRSDLLCVHNVMEEVVFEEIEKFLKLFPEYSNLHWGDIAAYALQSLPALYATTEQGREYQLENARGLYRSRIKAMIKTAIKYVAANPPNGRARLRKNSQTVNLAELETFFNESGLYEGKIDADNLLSVIQSCLEKAFAQGLEQVAPEVDLTELETFLHQSGLYDGEIRADNLLSVIQHCLHQARVSSQGETETDRVLLELEQYLKKKGLIGNQCEIYLGNLIDVIRFCFSQLRYAQPKAKPKPPREERLTDLDFYRLYQADGEQGDKQDDSAGCLTNFAQVIRDDSGKINSWVQVQTH